MPKFELKPAQQKGVDFMVANKEGVLNASEMGTGKTAMACFAIREIKPKSILVVGLPSILFNWKNSIEALIDDVDYQVITLAGTKQKRLKELAKSKQHDKNIVITNYEALNTLGDKLIECKPDLIVCDESHMIKSHKSIRSKAIKIIRDKSYCRMNWILTGTPTPNSPLDIWSQFDFIRRGYLGANYYAFRARYANVVQMAGFNKVVGYKNLVELKERVAKYTFRLTKEEFLKLPDKTFEVVTVQLSEESRKIYKGMTDNLAAEIGDQVVSARVVLTKMLRLQQITSGFIKTDEGNIIDIGSEKLECLSDLLDGLDEKVVVWCRFDREIERIKELVESKGRHAHVLKGGVGTGDRQKMIDEFQSPLRCNDVFISNPQAGGAGITLTAAKVAIYFSRSFSFGDSAQSEDRIHRIGQENNVLYIDIAAYKTIDGYILKALENKNKMSAFMNGADIKMIADGGF